MSDTAPDVQRSSTAAHQPRGQSFFGPRLQRCDCPACTAKREPQRAARDQSREDPLEAEAIDLAERIMAPGVERDSAPGDAGDGESGDESTSGAGGSAFVSLATGNADIPRLQLMADEDAPRDEALPASQQDTRSGPEPMTAPDGSGTEPVRDPATMHARLDTLAGQGAPLPEALLATFELRFSRGFAHVRIHTGPEAADMARDISARAFAYGQDIYFAEGQYRPHDPEGRLLIAHELVHTIQQSNVTRRPRVQKNDNIANPPPASLSVTLRELRFTPINGTWQDGLRILQGYAIMLNRLAGPGYRSDMVQGFLNWWPQAPRSASTGVMGDGLLGTGVAPMEAFSALGIVPYKMMVYVRDHAQSTSSLQLSQSQIRLVTLGKYTDRAWRYVQTFGPRGVVATLPAWVSEAQYFGMVGSRVTLLEAFRRAEDRFQADTSDTNRRAVIDALNAITASIRIQTDVVESIRTDATLINEAGYKILWPPPGPAANTPLTDRLRLRRTSIAGPSMAEGNTVGLSRMSQYVRTQPSLARRAVGSGSDATAARRELLVRFLRFFTQVSGGGNHDQQLTNNPGRMASHPPHPARLSAYPPLQPPFFDAATGTDHQFTMSLQFPSVFDAFQSYSYRFAQFKVPDAQVIGAAGGSAPAGQQPGQPTAQPPIQRPSNMPPASGSGTPPADDDPRPAIVPDPSVADTPPGTTRVEQPAANVLRTRLARDARYLRADVSAVLNDYGTRFGDPGTSLGLTAVGGLLRFAGTLIRSLFENIFEPRYAEDFVFESEGLYLIRAIAYPHNQDDAEVSRPPSVAYLPVFARDPSLMAEKRVQAQLGQQQAMSDRRAELLRQLGNPRLTGRARDVLQREYDDLTRSTGDVLTQLSHSYWQLDRQINQLTATILSGADASSDLGRSRLRFDRRAPQLRALIRQREAVRQMYHVRRRRNIPATAERLTATFVSDRGQAVNLLLEAANQTPAGVSGSQTWYVSDVTTPNSGHARRSGANKTAAIRAALIHILQSGAGYGRGQVSVVIDGIAHADRIEANSDQLLMEALENLATIASVAAIAAAPFTGGSSLYLLIPIGVIGAIPSAYRVAQRVDNQTFRWDLQTAMDVVNIVSSVLAVGQAAAGARAAAAATRGATGVAMRAYYLSNALMITGFGADGLGVLMMGGGLVAQLQATSDLPEGIRQARIAEIIGNAMLQVGIMAAGALASRRYQGAVQRGVEQSQGAYGRWLTGLDDTTRLRIEADPQLRETYGRMRADIREILTRCGSWCVPIDHPPDAALQQRLQTLVDRVNPTPDDVRYMQTYFHTRRNDLGAAIGAIEGHQSVTALRGALTSAVSASDAVLLRFAAHSPVARSPASRAVIDRILASGHSGVDQLGRIVDTAHRRRITGQRLIALLNGIEQLVTTAHPGHDHVMADLARGWGFFTGAEFVIRYLTDNSLWSTVTRFEITNHQGTRRWDAEIAGTLIQFKSWQVFYTDTFLRQFARDYAQTGGNLTQQLRWIFERRIGTRQQIEATAIQAIRDAHARQIPYPPYNDPAVVQAMITAINSGNLFMTN